MDKNRPTLNPTSRIDSSESSPRKEEERLTEKNQIETPHVIPKIGRKHKNKRENSGEDANLDDQSKKKVQKI